MIQPIDFACLPAAVGPAPRGAGVGEGAASFTTPWYASFSARYAVTDRLTLNAQVNRIGWSEFDAIRVTRAAGNTKVLNLTSNLGALARSADISRYVL